MPESPHELLYQTAGHALRYLEGVAERPVRPAVTPEELHGWLGGPLPEGSGDPATTVELLAKAGQQGSVASSGPRYFGFVIGGTLPVAIAADWLASAWDQNAGLYILGPTAAIAELVAAKWLVDLFGLPAGTSVGFPTGGMMANATALTAARHKVLADAGWDVEADGLQDAPRVHVVVGEERHATIDMAMRYLGLGTRRIKVVPSDAQGRMRADALPAVLAGCDGPTIVCAQVGNVDSGAVDPVAEICELAHRRGAWVHVDGAFGLWAAASPTLRPLVAGIERADSWATDGHKWLNVPYDCGLAFVTDSEAHQGSLVNTPAGYIPTEQTGERDPYRFVPEFSRRARGVPVWAALRTLGRTGVAALVDRNCAMARRFAAALSGAPGVEVLNEVVLNQVLVRFGADDAVTRDVIARVQDDGTCWLGGTTWHGVAAMRISVSNWMTAEEDVDRSVDAIRKAFADTAG